ncbi:MAG: sodium:solute symporter family protein [Planctomycetes bacterium]|nr:sodium:solute symporter family protein [Planctomycetota bacterium]
MIAVVIVLCYLGLLLGLGLFSNRFFKGTATDYFLASRSIGPFLLLMSLFGTTMTAFALVGSSGEAFKAGIGVYGKMASWSAIIHSAVFFLVGIKLWSFGKRYAYVTHIQFFRDRFESDKLGLVLFPILVGLVVPYLLIGVISAGTVIQSITAGAFPGTFPNEAARLHGAVPYWLGAAVICLVVLIYVFVGGVRGTAWANAFQTIVFMILGCVTFFVIADKLGGPTEATKLVQAYNPARLKSTVTDADVANYREKLAAFEADPKAAIIKPKEPRSIPRLGFLTYMFIPLSVGMFPHLFQHWLTARSAKSFRLSVIAHPVMIMIVWVPCVLIGIWATSAIMDGKPVIPPDLTNPNAVLAIMVKKMTNPWLGGFLTAGILAAIMSSLDSQFLCIGSIFTNDIVGHYIAHERLSDRQKVFIGRVFVVCIVAVTYLIAVLWKTTGVFSLAVWCFSGFASLFPLVFASIYWRRASKAGAYACVLVAAAVWICLFRESGYGANREYLFLGMMPVATVIGSSTFALVVVSLMTAPPSQATVDKFFKPLKSLETSDASPRQMEPVGAADDA